MERCDMILARRRSRPKERKPCKRFPERIAVNQSLPSNTNSRKRHLTNRIFPSPTDKAIDIAITYGMSKNQLILQLPSNVAGLYNLATQFECAKRITKLLCFNPPPIRSVTNSGAVHALVQFLQFTDPKLQLEAAVALTIITSGTTEDTTVVTTNQFGAVPLLIDLLESKFDYIKEQATWALGNISRDSLKCRNGVLFHGILKKLLPIFRASKEYLSAFVAVYMVTQFATRHINYQQDINLIIAQYIPSKQSLSRIATWTLSSLCCGEPAPNINYMKCIIKCLRIMIKSNDVEILRDVCWSLNYISKSQPKLFVNKGLLHNVIYLLDCNNTEILYLLLQTIQNIVAVDQCIQIVNKSCMLSKLRKLLQNSSSLIKCEICRILVIITSDSSDQIDSVIKSHLVKPLICLLYYGSSGMTKESLYAISNIVSNATDKQIAYLVQQNLIQALCRLSECSISETIIMMALQCIESILAVGVRLSENGFNTFAQIVKKAEMVTYLEQLPSDVTVSDKLNNKAMEIITTYFN
eukprot:473215_1